LKGSISHPDIPEPWTLDSDGNPTSYPLGGPRWAYDLWYDFICAAETGVYRNGDHVPRNADGGLDYSVLAAGTLALWNPPAFHQVTMSSWKFVRQYSADYDGVIAGLRMGNFITVLPEIKGSAAFKRLVATTPMEMDDETYDQQIEAQAFLAAYHAAGHPPLFTSYAPTVEALLTAHQEGRIYTRIGDRAVLLPPTIPLMSLAETLDSYFRHPESKAARPRAAGDVGVRSVRLASRIGVTGKETNRRAMMVAEETDGLIDGEEAGMSGAQVYGLDNAALAADRGRDFRALLRKPDGKPHTLADLMLATGLPKMTLSKLSSGKTKHPDPATLTRLFDGLALLDPGNPDTILGWKDVPNTVLAPALRAAPGDGDPPTEDELVVLRAVRRGKRLLPEVGRLALIGAIQGYLHTIREDEQTAAEADARAMLDSLWSQEHTTVEQPRGIRTYTADEMLALEAARMKAQAGR
jgi:hypothetical protein